MRRHERKVRAMQKSRLFIIMLMSVLLIISVACKDSPSGEGHGDNGEEEEGTPLGLDETYDAVRNGVRLILTYDDTSSSFLGTVENVVDQTVFSVRVEVHLSNGTELGPTPRTDLEPGEMVDVNLSAEGESFDWWTAHAETSGGGGEHGGDHGEHDEHGGEHG